jgi:HEAT repeat protein/predicted MFS family arabinose efflux permease
VALLTAAMLVPSVGGAMGSAAAQALFFARFGVEYLPPMYMALGAVTSLTSLLVTALLGRLPKRRLYLLLPVCLALLLVLTRFLTALDLRWVYPALWLEMNLFWTLQAFLGWGLAGALCDTRQARRLFPLFGAGGIVGVTAGGLLTRPLVAAIGSANLLLVWAGSLVLVAGVVHLLSRGLRAVPARSSGGWIRDLQRGYQSVRGSSLMRWLALAAVLFSVLFFSLAFPFSKGVTAQFPDEDALAGFLGVFRGLANGAAFLVSLLLANRLYARFGVMAALQAFPLLYLAGFALLIFLASFPALATFQFLQLLWLFGVSSTAYQTVFNLVPAERRDQTRAFIDGVPGQLGVVLTGAILALGERLQPRALFLFGALTAITTTYVVQRARRAFRGALTDALRAGQPNVFYGEEQPFGGFQQDAAAVAAVVAGVSDNDPAVRRVSAEILGNLAVPEAAPALAQALDDPDPEVRAALLRALARAGAGQALLEVAACLQDPEAEVRLQAVESLRQLAGYPRGLRTHLLPLLQDGEPAVRAQAAAALLQHGREPRAEQVLHELAASGEAGSRAAAMLAFAEWGDVSAFEAVAHGLRDAAVPVRRTAAAALARLAPERAAALLTEALGDPDAAVRRAAAEALGTLGETAVQPALQALQQPTQEDGALQALSSLSLREGETQVQQYAQRKTEQATRYDELFSRVEAAGQDDGLELLAHSLRHAGRQQATRAFLALGLLQGFASTSLAVENLNSRVPAQLANALESLESLRPRALVGPLIGLWDSAGRVSVSGQTPSDSLPGSLRTLLADADPWLRACAALAARGLNDPQLLAALEDAAGQDPDETVRETARRTLDGGASMQTLPTISLMERVLFLRRVPLFADLQPAELKQVASIAQERLFSDGEAICRQGEAGEEMFIVISGEARVVVETEGGQSRDLARRRPGEVVGEMAIITQEPRMASVLAAGPVRLLSIDRRSFEGMLRERPETGLAVMRVLSQRLREAQGSSAS